MAHTPTCLVCKKEMEPGLLVDRGEGNAGYLARWCAGTAQAPRAVVGVQIGEVSATQVDSGLRVVAYRCPECQALRLYAPSAPSAPAHSGSSPR